MATLELRSAITGLDELRASLGSITAAIEAAGSDATLEIEGDDHGASFQGAPIITVGSETKVEGGVMTITTTIRPGPGLGMLAAIANIRCDGRLVATWDGGWPRVTYAPPEPG